MKKALCLVISIIFLFILASCGETEHNTSGTIKADFLSASEVGISEEYVPLKSDIKQRSGKININLDFEGRHVGWQAVATEYERLQGGAVTVSVNWKTSGSEYGTKLNEELIKVSQQKDTEWDIVEGNLGYSNTGLACIDITTFIHEANPYCGHNNERWSDLLSPRAYHNSDVDTKTSGIHILNTEDMQSCWFVNDVSFQEAVKQGYLNSEGKAEYPVTWDDLINLCVYMEKAGYNHPLGISLSEASVKSLQFTWLLRIYGDYYYRQYYKYIMGGDSNSTWDWYDATKPNIELTTGFGTKACKSLNLLFDEETTFGPGYCGYKSEVYVDFVSQLAKMKGHLIQNVSDTEFTTLRNQFRNQSSGKDSAQIILDYIGQGIQYIGSENENLKIGYFDYPHMVSGKYTKSSITGAYEVGDSIVPEETITRDIGGNGGFVSIIDHRDAVKNDLNIDFIRFFLSPYGQSIYYKGLYESEDNIVPKGLTTVDNDCVNIPESWVEYFDKATGANGPIKFNGNVDSNPFISFGVRYFLGYDQTENHIVELWRRMLTGTGKFDADSFGSLWHNYCFQDYLSMCKDSRYGWNVDTYKNPNLGY